MIVVLLVNVYSGIESQKWLIVGGGLAGFLVAREALNCGVKVTICDPFPGRNAPPAGVLHPYPGRRFVQSIFEVEAFAQAQRVYSDLARNECVKVKRSLPVVRPTEGQASKTIQHSEDKFDRKYLNQTEVEGLWPEFNAPHGAITYNSGMVIDVGALVKTLVLQSAGAGAQIIPFLAESLEKRGNGWYAHGDFGEVGPFSAVVCAVGSEHNSLLNCKAASRNFGSLALYSDDELDDEFQVIVSSRGHFAPLPGGGYVIGSTYIHLDDVGAVPVWRETSEAEHLAGIRNRLLRYQHLGEAGMQLWHGSRATVPQDKQPIVGLLSSKADGGLWMIGGLASRGLFWAPWLATTLVGAMLGKSAKSLPTVFAPERLKGFDRGRFEDRSVVLR
jgi:glycine/D-amino acid oxidase-like deaminating enzyme